MRTNLASSLFVNSGEDVDAPVAGVRRKMRIFQTDLSDIQLYDRSLAIIHPPENDDIWNAVFWQENLSLERNKPILYGFDQPKSYFVGTVPSVSATAKIKKSQPDGWAKHFEQRTAALKEAAGEEELPFSDLSFTKAKAFLSQFSFAQIPSVFLSGNGNVRLVWENDSNEQVALHFKPDGMIQYVMFRCSSLSEEPLEEVMGLAKATSLKKIISSLEFDHLLIADE